MAQALNLQTRTAELTVSANPEICDKFGCQKTAQIIGALLDGQTLVFVNYHGVTCRVYYHPLTATREEVRIHISDGTGCGCISANPFPWLFTQLVKGGFSPISKIN